MKAESAVANQPKLDRQSLLVVEAEPGLHYFHPLLKAVRTAAFPKRTAMASSGRRIRARPHERNEPRERQVDCIVDDVACPEVNGVPATALIGFRWRIGTLVLFV